MKRVLLGLGAALLFAAPAQAADYVVNGTGDAPDAYCEGTACQSLRAAVVAATQPTSPGPHTITLPAGTIELREGALPALSTGVTIIGAGTALTTVQADADGGRVFEVTSATASFNDLTLQGGNATQGGSLLAQTSTVTLTRVRVTGGRAESGAGIANRSSTMFLYASLLDRNIATQGDGVGGGIINLGDAVGGPSNLTLTNTTIADNTAKTGGGLVSTGNPANVVDTLGVTIGQNRSTEGAGGVHIGAGSWTPELTLVADNLREQTPLNCTGTPGASEGWNVENFDECGFRQDPDRRNVLNTRLATSLADNGGPTMTLALLDGSQALNIRTAGCPSTDQRGTTRPQGTGCDAGAFERAGLPSAPPVVTAPSGTDLYTGAIEMTFAGTADPGAAIEIYLTGLVAMTEADAQGNWSTRFELPAADGDYAYGVSANGSARASVELTVDRTRPETTIDTKPTNPTNSPTAAFTYSSNEPGTFACRFFGPDHPDTTYSACPVTGSTYTDLAPGEYTFGVQAVDRAGNVDDTPDSYTFVVSVGPPITSPAADARVRPTFILQGTSTPGATIAVTLGTEPVGGGTADGQGLWAVSVGTLPEGEQTLSVTADNGPATTRAFIVDVAPIATIDARPPATINRGEAAFTYGANEPGTFRCRLVGPGRDDNEEPCSNAGMSYSGLLDGAFEFRVRAVDQTGAGDATVYAFTVDSALIATPEVAAPATEPTAATLTFSTAPDRMFRCRLEGPGQDGAFAPCASPQPYTNLQAGAYRFTVRSSDQFGNFADSSPREFAVSGPVVAAQQTPAPTPAPSPTATTPAPHQNETVVVRPTGGKVLIQLPGLPTFIELESIDDIPLGAIIDARNGRVQLRFESEPGKVQTAVFYGGIFQIRQAGKVLDLKLTEALAACPRKGKAAAAQSKKAKKRKLWGDGKGSFRTTGKYSAATVRGTKWLIEDSCAGTLTRVVSGVVAVKDRNKTILVRAGKRYLAKAR